MLCELLVLKIPQLDQFHFEVLKYRVKITQDTVSYIRQALHETGFFLPFFPANRRSRYRA